MANSGNKRTQKSLPSRQKAPKPEPGLEEIGEVIKEYGEARKAEKQAYERSMAARTRLVDVLRRAGLEGLVL